MSMAMALLNTPRVPALLYSPSSHPIQLLQLTGTRMDGISFWQQQGAEALSKGK